MSKKDRSKELESTSLVVDARDRKTLDFEDVERLAKLAKRTRSEGRILVNEQMQIPEDLQKFAQESNVEIKPVAYQPAMYQ